MHIAKRPVYNICKVVCMISSDPFYLSTDQEKVWKYLQHVFDSAADTNSTPDFKTKTSAILGRAGSGKTVILANAVTDIQDRGFEIIQPEHLYTSKRGPLTACVLAPTNKAASVLRQRGVPATTLHRVLYVPLYDPQYEEIVNWLENPSDAIPSSDNIPEHILLKAQQFYTDMPSVPGALTAAGLKGADFISGWKRREETLSLGLVDEASMLDARQLEDLQTIFHTLVLFGDPAQLAPVVATGGKMIFDKVKKVNTKILSRIHRQAQDSPILVLADLLQTNISFDDFSDKIHELGSKHTEIVISPRVDSDIAAKSPVLVWRNTTRIKMIGAFRTAFNISSEELLIGEPLICDGIELPVKHRNKRFDLEARGLVKGAQVIYKGPGRKPGFAKLWITGAPDPQVTAAAIIHIEQLEKEKYFLPSAAKMGARFVHGAACTVHKAQGSQWPIVQLFAPDFRAAAYSGKDEDGVPLWRRLAYVAVTRAQEKLVWITSSRMSKPKYKL